MSKIRPGADWGTWATRLLIVIMLGFVGYWAQRVDGRLDRIEARLYGPERPR